MSVPQLPENWSAYKIGVIAELTGGGTPSRRKAEYFAGSIPWLTGYDLPEDSVSSIDMGREYITEEAIQGSATNRVPAKTVLLTTRVTVGKVAVAEVPLCFSQDVTGIKLHELSVVDPYYVAHFMLANRLNLVRFNRGSTITGVTRDDVARIEIPLPPLLEQRRIVAILRQADDLRHERREIDMQAKQLLPALFQEMFDGFDTNGRFEMRQLREVAEVVSGVAKGRRISGSVTVPYVRVANVQAGYLDLSEIKMIEALPSEIEELALRKGDVLLAGHADPGR